ncbi:MAG: hypothetical protein PVI54_12085 [Desulfobacteraceae bacterium]|jgi:hypothetical protein
MAKNETDALLVSTLEKVKGINRARPFAFEDRAKITKIEADAQKQSLMGLGKVVNVGVTKVLHCDLVYVALTNMDFSWGCHATLVLKKGDEIVGEEVRDKGVIARLSNREDVWFMHKNFVVYKDKISFPQDIMKKICFFEIPCLPAEWCLVEDDQFECSSIIYANPCTPADIYLKEQYFDAVDEKGSGTILVGIES